MLQPIAQIQSRAQSVIERSGVFNRARALLEQESWLLLLPAILVAALSMSSVQWSTPSIIGVDGLYHIKIAEVMRLAGLPAPIAFPWLQLTILNPRDFTDHHLLFHLVLEPFTFGDLRVGAKLAAATFATLAVLSVYALMYWQGVRWSFVWLLLLLGSSSAFLYRMSMTRRQALVLILIIALIAVAFARRDRLAVLVGFLFSWTFDGFLLFILIAGALTMGRWVDDRKLTFKLGIFAVMGVLLGFLINPYAPRSLTFAIEHALPKLVPMGNYVVNVGNEWYPYGPAVLARQAGVAIALAIIGFIPMILTAFVGRRWDGRTVSLALLNVFFLVLLIRSRRFVEYQPAFALIFCAFSWSFQLPSEAREWLKARAPRWSDWLLRLILIAVAGVLMRGSIAGAQSAARASRSPEVYAGAARWLIANTPAGSRVFTTDWDDFPPIYYQNTHNTYLIGLDPTYMYQYDERLYRLWRAIGRGEVEQPSAPLLSEFDSRWVLSDLAHENFEEAAGRDPRMRQVYRDFTTVVYQVDDP